MLPKPETYVGIVECVLERVNVVSLARIVADYTFIDTTIAARILVEHRPVYTVNPNGWNIPAYVSISPEELDGSKNKWVRIRIDHISDFPHSPEYRGKYSELYHLNTDHRQDDEPEIELSLSPIWTEPPLLMQKILDPNTCREFMPLVMKNLACENVVEASGQQEVDGVLGDTSHIYRETLVKKLVAELGSDEDNGGKLFRMIREDIETIMVGEVPFVPRPIPFKWPPTFEDLLEKSRDL